MFHEVAVTGVGVLTSIGGSLSEFARSLRAGVCGITTRDDGLGVMGRLTLDFDDRIAALRLPNNLAARALKAGRRAPPSARSSIATALEAWMQAFERDESVPSTSINLIVAGNNISPAYQHSMYEKYNDSPEFIPASYALHFLDTDQVGIVSEVLGIEGEGCTVGAASASGGMGIVQAWRQVRHGVAERCIVVGAMTDLSPMELHAFRNTGALGGERLDEPERACRPFDRKRDGFIYGQGSACLLLESADAAAARGARALGYIAGAAACLDANRLSHPSSRGEARAMRLALEQAGVAATEVDYVNAHGTGSVVGDEAELEALKEIFGGRTQDIWINATKGLTGHCLHAAGVVELAATLVQMNEGFVHPNLNLDDPIDPACGFVGPTAQDADIRVALSNSFGFGGINTSIIVTRARPTSAREHP